VLSGAEPGLIASLVSLVVRRQGWVSPVEYTKANVSDTVAKIVLGYLRRK